MTCRFPSFLKVANIAPIFKKGSKNKNELVNKYLLYSIITCQNFNMDSERITVRDIFNNNAADKTSWNSFNRPLKSFRLSTS